MKNQEWLDLNDFFDDLGQKICGSTWKGNEIRTLVLKSTPNWIDQPFKRLNNSTAKVRAKRIERKLCGMITAGEDIAVEVLIGEEFVPIHGDFKFDQIYVPGSCLISSDGEWFVCRIAYDINSNLEPLKRVGAKRKHPWLDITIEIQRHLYKNGNSLSKRALAKKIAKDLGLNSEDAELRMATRRFIDLYKEFRSFTDVSK
ncbi:MAG: hypothetical protein KA155_08015 [Alphaproteobacteria bacterium]|nr:hypothetical protein [Alphaproteobacteria bacterium]